MATVAYQLTQQLSCHAWSNDLLQLAICPNSHEIYIYKKLASGQWTRTHVLSDHDQLVSGLDWTLASNQLVSCSHDRNSYVFSWQEQDWKPEMVLTRLSKAATCVKWSPCQHKFAIGSAAKAVCICYYEHESHWWASKLIRKAHDSTILMVAWHPNSLLLATASSDSKCRVFSTVLPGIDSPNSLAGTSTKFGDCLLQIDSQSGWCHAVAWSPSGAQLCFASHGSSVHLVSNLNAGDMMTAAPVLVEQFQSNSEGFGHHLQSQPHRQIITFSQLPHKVVAFLNEDSLVAGGFESDLYLFTRHQGRWLLSRKIPGQPQQDPNTAQLKKGSSADFSKKLDMFKQQNGSPAAKAARGVQHSSELMLKAPHTNCIVDLHILHSQHGHGQEQLATADVDGRIVLWDVAKVLAE